MIEEVALYKPRRNRAVRRKNASRTRVGGGGSVPQRKKSKVRKLSLIKKDLEALQKQLVILTYGRDCYTCPQKDLQGTNCQLGHVPWPRSDLSAQAKFLIAYTRIQCYRCNINLGGAGAKALQRMLDEGIDVILLRKWSEDHKGLTVPRQWFLDKIEEYKRAVENLTPESINMLSST